MPSIHLILNPAADRGYVTDRELEMVQQIKSLALAHSSATTRYTVISAMTEAPWHAVELARKAGEAGADMVVALGGDGTIHEIVNGLMQVEEGKRPVLGIIPLGSGNDFSHNAGLPTRPDVAARVLFSGVTRPVDVGTICDEHDRLEYWINTIGIGFSGAVNAATRNLTRLRGFAIYFVAVLKTVAARNIRDSITFRADDAPPLRMDATMVSLCNGEREGGGFAVCPGAELDDGLISYSLIRALTRLGILRLVPVVMQARQAHFPRTFTMGKARQVVLESEGPLYIHLDGELFGLPDREVSRIDVTMIRHAIRLAVER